MKEGLLRVARFGVSSDEAVRGGPLVMVLHAGLDLSRKRLDYCLLDESGAHVEVGAAPPDADGLDGFARRVERRHGPMVEVRRRSSR